MNLTQIAQLLDNLNIPYWTSGKNISKNSIGIQCPFCNDPSNHCGIFSDTDLFSCWRCNEKGTLFKLIQKLTRISYEEFEDITENISVNFKMSASEQIQGILGNKPTSATKLYKESNKISLPKYAKEITLHTKSKLLERFLGRRHISLERCVKYKCLICEIGEYSHRMVIPIFFLRKLVGYQAVDLTGHSKLKYKTSSTNVNNFLYNYDSVYCCHTLILVEGIFDVWRLDTTTVCSFGTHLTDTQRKLVLEIKPKEIIFCWDSDAYFKARAVASWFRPFVEKIKVVKLPEEEDPDSLGKERTLELTNMTNWY